ncbi:MAG: ribonuclease HI family protein [bacterium]|nr:ribonuclease HI family protein [bacterium]
MDACTLFTDGGARGNPGPAAIGYVIIDGSTVLAERGETIGQATNNVAEYTALLRGLTHAKKLGALTVACKLDSLLVVEQLNRNYKVKDANLAKLFTKVWNLTHDFQRVTFSHIPREQNAHADALVNAALDAT